MRRLDLLVPHWKETPELMEPLLDTLKVQRCVDLSQVGVIIAFDGPEATELPLDEWRERYPFAIEDVHPPKGGVSATRNAALRASRAEYVQFVDADDCFLDVRGLYIVFREMDIDPDPREVAAMGVDPKEAGKGFDFIFSDFIEETKDPETGKMDYVSHVDNAVFVHGQVARRQWLIDNDLLFSDSIQVHEDSYWVCLCRNVVKPWRGRVCRQPWFLWAWNSASTCRRSPETYILETYPSMLRSNWALVDQLLKRSLQERAAEMFVSMVWDAFYTMNKKEWVDLSNKQFRDTVEREFAKHFKKHESLWDGMPMQQKLMISQGVRQRSVLEGMLMEAQTIDQWLEHIKTIAE